MTTKKKTTLLSLASVIVMTILIADTFLLPLKEAYRICKDKSSQRMSSLRRRQGHMEYVVTDEQEQKYYVSNDFCLVINIGEKFIISKTALFGKAVRINFKLDLSAEQEKIGIFNSNWFAAYGSILLIATSLLVLIYPQIFKKEITANRVSQLIAFITAVVVFCYFYNQA